MGVKFDAAAPKIDVDHFHLSCDQIAGAHRCQELQRLSKIDGAMAGQLLANHGGDQAGG